MTIRWAIIDRETGDAIEVEPAAMAEKLAPQLAMRYSGVTWETMPARARGEWIKEAGDILDGAFAVVTNVGPGQQDQAHDIAHAHARRVAGLPPEDV